MRPTIQQQVNTLVEKHGYESVRNAIIKTLRRDALKEAYENVRRKQQRRQHNGTN